MSLFRLTCFLVLATVFASCESVTSPIAEVEPPSASDNEELNEWSARQVAVCHVVEPGLYRRVTVLQDAVRDHLRHGDELAGGSVLDDQCRPVQQAVACACFTADSLATPLAGAAPAPYVFFDVFNYYDEDPRRSEVRSTLSTDAGAFEEVAAVYITPTGDPDAPLAPLCFYQDAVLDGITGEPTYTYTTRGLSIPEAESCRMEIEAFADGQQTCQGAACDMPYTDEQLDPDYPPYHNDGYRTPDSVLDAMQARIEAVRERLTLTA